MSVLLLFWAGVGAAVAGLVALVTNVLVSGRVRLNAVDVPNARSLRQRPTLRGGGDAVSRRHRGPHRHPRPPHRCHVACGPRVGHLMRIAYLCQSRLVASHHQGKQVDRLHEDKSFDYGAAPRDFRFSPRSFEDGVRAEVAMIRATASPQGTSA